jgi:hypothetical protein
MMELSRKGVSGQNKPLFQFPDAHYRTASLPYLKITFLEALASAYEAAKRPDDADKFTIARKTQNKLGPDIIFA